MDGSAADQSFSSVATHQKNRRSYANASCAGGPSVRSALAEGHEGKEGKVVTSEGKGDGIDGEGGEVKGEKSEEQEEMEENAIKARWGFAFVTIIIIFSVAFVQAAAYIKKAVPEELEEVCMHAHMCTRIHARIHPVKSRHVQ